MNFLEADNMKSKIDFEVLEGVFDGLITGQQRCCWKDLLNKLGVNTISEFKEALRSSEEVRSIAVTACGVMGMRIQWFKDYYIYGYKTARFDYKF